MCDSSTRRLAVAVDQRLTCGACGKPLDPNGRSLYFCPPENRSADSACQTRWMEARADLETYRPAGWEPVGLSKDG